MATQELTYDLVIEINKSLKNIEQFVDKANSKASQSGKNAGQQYGMSFGKAVGAIITSSLVLDAFYALNSAVSEYSKSVFDSAVETEKQGIAFRVMLGSGEKAQKLFTDLNNMALQTPFDVADLRDVAKSMLSYGIPLEKIVDTTRTLGDISAGTGGDLKLLAKAYGQVQTKGKLYAQELNQLGEQGLAVRDILANKLGVSIDELVKGMETGDITVTFEEFAKIVEDLHKSKFLNLMAEQSQTLGGRMQNLAEQANLLGQELLGINTVTGNIEPGSAFDIMTSALKELMIWVGQNKEAIKEFGKALMKDLINGLKEAGKFIQDNQETIKNIVIVLGSLATAFVIVSTAINIFNGVMAVFAAITSPIGLVILALGALIALVVWAQTEFGIFTPILESLGKFFGYVWDQVKLLGVELQEKLEPVIKRLNEDIMPKLKEAFLAIQPAIQAFLEFIKPVVDLLRDTLSIAIESAINTFNNLLTFFSGFIDLMVGIFTGNGEKVKQGFIGMFSGIASEIGNIFTGIMKLLVNNINFGIRMINGMISGIEIPGFGKIAIPEIKGFANGGLVHGAGSSTSDSILARLSNGEFVMNARAVQMNGMAKLNAMNSGKVDNSRHDNDTWNITNIGGVLPTYSVQSQQAI